MTINQISEGTKRNIDMLTADFAKQFVQKDSKFYDVAHLGNALSKPDVERIILNLISDRLPPDEISNELVKAVYGQLLSARSSDRSRTIQVWNGTSVCLPGNPERLHYDQGAVSTNVWVVPPYRNLKLNSADAGPIAEFLDHLFKSAIERDLFLNWLSYCIQHENEKPSWAPFFYSSRKGTGKSTLCRIMAEIFGETNTAVQNNIDKLTQQFNATLLRSKLVICEETHLQQGSSKGNAIKTYITDPFILIEQKGKEQVRARNVTCFAFTSNFLPDWMEPGERRYAVFDVDHDGAAGGPNANDFAHLVGQVHSFLDDPANVARFYNFLLARELPDTFNAKSLNIVENATTLMKRLQETSRQTVVELLEEYLNTSEILAIPQLELAAYVRDEMRGNANQVRHLMNGLGWRKESVKWGGVDYARAIWVRPEYTIDGGKLYGPDCKGVAISDCVRITKHSDEVEFIV